MENITIAKGDVLFHEGQLGDRMYIITEGKVKARAHGAGRAGEYPRHSRSGELLGELSLFDPGPRTATAVALTDLTALGLGHAALRPW